MKIEEELDGRFRNEYHKGFINLIFTTNHLNYELLQVLKEHGLSPQQFNILKVLRGFGNKPRSIDFLRERMLDKKSDISRVIDRLCTKGLINRSECKQDRRQKDITITKKGLEILASMDPHEKKVDELLINLNTTEVTQLNKILDKIRSR